MSDKYRTASLSSIKQWLMMKFQQNLRDDTGSPHHGIRYSGGGLPKIIISGGSDRSINKCVSPAASPMSRRPSPLVKKRGINKEPPFSVPYNSGDRKFWEPISVPCTPMHVSSRNMRSDSTVRQKSPVFLFSKRNNLPLSENYGNLSPGPSLSCSRSVLDSPSLCGACGQRKFYGSRDFIGFEPPCGEAIFSALNTRADLDQSTEIIPKNSRLGLRRTSSCRAPDKDDAHLFSKSTNITKAVSNVDVMQRRDRVKRTGSKEKANSMISLTRSWSFNLETFRIVKNNSIKSHNPRNDRKMSLNDNDLRRGCERRRSSLLRLLCHEISDSDKDEDGDESDSSVTSSAERTIERNILEYSPKVTRANKFASGDPLDDFKSTFESDSVRIPSIYGQIKLMFQYFNEKSEFQLTVLKGSNIAKSTTGTLGLFTKVCLMPGKIQKKTGNDKHDTSDPVFYQPFTFKMSLAELLDRELRIKLYNKPGIFSISEPVGECLIPLHQFDLTAVTVIWQDLKKCKGQKDDLDVFDFSPLERDAVKPTKGFKKLLSDFRKH